MPPLLNQESPLDPPGPLPHSASSSPSPLPPHPSPLSSQLLRHYIPVLTRSVTPECTDSNMLPAQLAPTRRPAGISLNVTALPDIYAEDDGPLHDSELLMQLSPASSTQLGLTGASPTSLSALSALRRFLPSNLDGIDALQYDMYSGDEFRMYEFKVRRCMRGRSHDWTQCPFAHPGEKARRRDPRRYHYSGVACPDHKKGTCKKGDACDLAHGVFESWLHPTRYRTQPCKDGRSCQRRVCFFAHTPDQLRVGSPVSASPCTSPPDSFLCSDSMEVPSQASDFCGTLSPTASCILLNSSLSEPLPVTSSQFPLLANAGISSASRVSPRSRPLDLFSHVSTGGRSPCMSPKELSMQNGITTFMLPTSTTMEFCQSLQSNHLHASMPAYNGMFSERRNPSISFSAPSLQKGSKVAVPSPSSPLSVARHSSHNVEELVGLLKQVSLAKDEERFWQNGRLAVPERSSMLQSACGVSTGSTYMRCRGSEEMSLHGGLFAEEEDRSEPRLERVESGRGLRAQIFESLLSSASASGIRGRE